MTPYWHCTHCNKAKPAIMERGRPKVRMLRGGFVAVFLACGHTAAVRKDRLS